jgi:hypothetical protein
MNILSEDANVTAIVTNRTVRITGTSKGAEEDLSLRPLFQSTVKTGVVSVSNRGDFCISEKGKAAILIVLWDGEQWQASHLLKLPGMVTTMRWNEQITMQEILLEVDNESLCQIFLLKNQWEMIRNGRRFRWNGTEWAPASK